MPHLLNISSCCRHSPLLPHKEDEIRISSTDTSCVWDSIAWAPFKSPWAHNTSLSENHYPTSDLPPSSTIFYVAIIFIYPYGLRNTYKHFSFWVKHLKRGRKPPYSVVSPKLLTILKYTYKIERLSREEAMGFNNPCVSDRHTPTSLPRDFAAICLCFSFFRIG